MTISTITAIPEPEAAVATAVHADVQTYYGRVLASQADLKTSACCTGDSLPPYVRAAAAALPDEVVARFYGCGSPIPDAITGATVVDLGCGTGRDAFLLAGLVGRHGRVIGVDMTPQQLDVARRHRDDVCATLGVPTDVVDFRHGYMEDLASVGIADASVDTVISNCVLNLAPDKRRVFAEIMRVLKPGGELLFSDVFADRRLPADLMNDPMLVGECLAGAMYGEDFRRMLANLGVADVRTVRSSTIELHDPEVIEKIGFAKFTSRTVRVFNLPLEDRCEDHGQIAIYRGGIPGSPHTYVLDDHHTFERNRPERVCGNTAAMLRDSRLGAYFDVLGDNTQHFGLFTCGPTAAGTVDSGPAPCC